MSFTYRVFRQKHLDQSLSLSINGQARIQPEFLNTNSKSTSTFPADELIHNQPNVGNHLTLEPGTHCAAVSAVSEPMNTSSSFKFYYVFYIRCNKAMQCSQLAKASRGQQCLQIYS